MAQQEQIAEQALDILEDQLDVIEDQVKVVAKSAGLLKRIIWNHKTHIGVSFVVGAGIGSAVTYKVAKDKFTARFEDLLSEEIERTKEHYSRRNLTGDYSDPITAAEKLLGDEAAVKGHEALREYQGVENGDSPESREEVEELVREEVRQSNRDNRRRNVFDNEIEEFDWDEETARREQIGDSEPYIITREEYVGDEELETKLLTYYHGDDTMADDEDNALTDDQEEALIGDNLRFGYGSDDSNIVYVRNPRVGLNMEIVRSPGHYTVEVLGLNKEPEDELRHSTRRPAGRKMRATDE